MAIVNEVVAAETLKAKDFDCQFLWIFAKSKITSVDNQWMNKQSWLLRKRWA